MRVIVEKEWDECFRNMTVLFSFIFLPLLFAALASGTVYMTSRTAAEDAGMEEIEATMGAVYDESQGPDGFLLYFASVYLTFFMLLPAILPGVFAAHSIVGEKVARTLEPLLATPIRTTELLAGKALAAVIPSLAASWSGVFLYLFALATFLPVELVAELVSFQNIFVVGVLGFLLSVMGVELTMIISSRSRDPRIAQQLSGLVVMPILFLFVGQLAGFLAVTPLFALSGAVILGSLDVALACLAVKLFDRESILTKWK